MKTIEKLHGTWQVVAAFISGDPMPKEIVDATRLSVAGITYEVNLAGNIDAGSICVIEDEVPIRMEVRGESGPNAGKIMLAIVERFDESGLRIAYDLSGTAFPSSFEPVSDPANYVATFEKVVH